MTKLFVRSLLCLFTFGCGSSANDAGVPANNAGTARGGDAGITTGGDAGTPSTGAACTAIASRETARLPHVHAAGEKANAVVTALNAVLAAQSPAVAAGKSSYSIAALSCRNLVVPGGIVVDGYTCDFTVSVDKGANVDVHEPAPSQRAQALFEALGTAGATHCNDQAHGDFRSLDAVTITLGAQASIDFDDASTLTLPKAPNLVAKGADAKAIVDAFVAGGINDCDLHRDIILVCNALAGAPDCSYRWQVLTASGTSELMDTCGNGSGSETTDGATLDAAGSLRLWKSLLSAAKTAGFKPLSGTLDEVTVINADTFGSTGTDVSMNLVADQVSSPTSPPARP